MLSLCYSVQLHTYTIPPITGTGKTYTMLGTDAEPGIMVLTLNDLFRRMEQDQHVMKYRATIAYLEVQRPLTPILFIHAWATAINTFANLWSTLHWLMLHCFSPLALLSINTSGSTVHYHLRQCCLLSPQAMLFVITSGNIVHYHLRLVLRK